MQNFGRSDNGMYPEKVVEYPDQTVIFRREPRWGLWYVTFKESSSLPDALKGKFSDYERIKNKVDLYLSTRVKRETPEVRYDKRHGKVDSNPSK